MTSAQPPAVEKPAYAWFVVATLGFVYMFNFLDRQLLSVLAEPIKAELGLTDTQLGALTGLTFALFYSVFGVPIALLADRWNRVRVVAIACGIWSLFTALCGFASSFALLALARVGVGVGEAGGSPPSYSIISDYFPPERRGGALAAYSMGVPLGSVVGIASGAWIASEFGWRAAFIAVGAAGALLAPLVMLAVREPSRGRFDSLDAGRAEPPAAAKAAVMYFLRSPTLMLNATAAGLMAFVGYGVMNWAPAYLLRTQGMSLAEFAAVYSLVSGAGMAGGLWLGGLVANRIGRDRPFAAAVLPGVAMLLAAPFLWAFTQGEGWRHALPWLLGPLVLCGVYLAPALAIVQNLTPPNMRATVSALLLFLLNLIGIGGGPLFVGLISDALAPRYGAAALGHALVWLTPVMVAACGLQILAARSLARRQVSAPA